MAKKDIDVLIEEAEKQIDYAYKAMTENQKDRWFEMFKNSPGAQGAFVSNPFFILLKTEMHRVLASLSFVLEKAAIADVPKLQGSITVYRSLLSLLERIEKINSEKMN